MRTLALVLVLLTTSLSPLGLTQHANAAQSDFFQTHYDKIPNFAQNPTITSTQSGAWSQASTWSPAHVPTANDIVLITHDIAYDTTSGNVTTIGIDTGGALRFITNQATKLHVGTLLVMPGGTLQVGTEANPIPANITAEIIINDQPLDLLNDGVGVFDPEQFGTGLIVLDGTVTMHGTSKPNTFVRLASEPKLGQTTLTTAAPLTGWQPGDQLILPDTRQLKENEQGNNYIPQWEELTVQSISGAQLTLTQPLQYDHLGAHDADGTLRFLPHVGNLSRNVVIRSANQTGTRGHILVAHRSNIDIRYVQLENLGRNTINPLDNTILDSNGNVTHLGTNQNGRFTFHAHHLIGPSTTPANGYQYTFIGNAIIESGGQDHRFKGGIDIHDSHYGLIQNNVLYNRAGVGIATWGGSESHNVFERNFVVRVSGSGGRADHQPPGGQGSGFWLRSVNDTVRDNVVANISPVLDTFAYVIYNKYVGTKQTPAFKGADPQTNGTATNMHALPLREFARNEAYGALDGGMTIWWVGTNWIHPQNGPQSVIQDFRVWHAHRRGFWNYAISHVLIDGMTIQGNASHPSGTALVMTDYLTDQVIIRNADIRGMKTGILVPVRFSENNPTFIIENSYFQNTKNMNIDFLWNCCGVKRNPRKVIIRNVKFEPLGTFPLQTITMRWIMDFETSWRKGDLIELSQVFVENYNQVPGDNFQVFYKQQAPDAVVLQASNNLTGSPDAGMNNQFNWAQHHIANSGEMALCLDETSHPEIFGFTCQGTFTPGPTDTTAPQSPQGLTLTAQP